MNEKKRQKEVSGRKLPSKGKGVIQTPYNKDAHWAEDRDKGRVGHRLQVSETAEDGVTKQLVTDIGVVDANDDDSEVIDAIQERLIARDLKPEEYSRTS